MEFISAAEQVRLITLRALYNRKPKQRSNSAVHWEWSPSADDGRPGKEVKFMSLFGKSADYLGAIKRAVKAMGGMICSGELSPDTQVHLIIRMLETETETADTITAYRLDVLCPNGTAVCKRAFIAVNKRVISHIEKLQPKESRFACLAESLQLENSTLESELSLMFD